MKGKQLLSVVLSVMVLNLTVSVAGCQKNPDSSIVVNKDMEKLIEEAQDGEGTSNMQDMKKYDTYQTTLEDTSLGVKVTVDAKVDIPDTNQMSVIRVTQKEISQELLDKVKKELIPKETLYDGGIITSIKTRSEIEAEISSLRSEMKNQENEPVEDRKVLQEEYQSQIDALQEKYENAPTEIKWKGNESDGLLHSTTELLEQDPANEFYSWENDLNPEGEVYFGINDGGKGKYISLFVQNNENNGNCLRYRKNGQGYVFNAQAYVGSSNLNDPRASLIWKADEEIPEKQLEMMQEGAGSLTADEKETTTISQEEAQKIADTFLKSVGLDEYQYYEGGLYCEVMDIRKTENSELKYNTHYIFRYARNIDGAFVTFDGKSKHSEVWVGDDYVKKDWPIESIEFRISDDGITGFDYNAPLEETETVVEASGMKIFEEIKSVFEKMVIVANAQEGERVSIQVDRVVLGYARISEEDSYDTGLLVPVWDFQGTKTDENGITNFGSVLTVNAINGSVIDRAVGY